MADVLASFSAPTRAWFERALGTPTPPQERGWPAILRGEHTLIAAPTGSGKTLAAFLGCLDRLHGALAAGEDPRGIHTLYVSPLKALDYDIERNLRIPLAGIGAAARELGLPDPELRVGVRTGDTSASRRAAMLRRPPHVLITTPESLFLLLSSPRARATLSAVRYVIVDELHALLGNKRGASLALSLERLAERPGPPPVRIGLSATLRPLDEAARFLGGREPRGDAYVPRPVTVIDAGGRKALDVQVLAPVADFTRLPEDSVWPAVHPLLLAQIRAHTSTLVFVGLRAQSERVTRAINELAGEELARPHHGSVAAAVRRRLERELKDGRLPALVATGTLELGIDVGAIDLVLQLGSPHSVSAGLQRVGRAGHLLAATSKGRIVPLFREDLVECAVIARRMLAREVEAVRMPRNALDVLAQHVLSETVAGDRDGAELLALARRAEPYASLTRGAFDAVLGLLAGRGPAAVVRGLSSKLVWDRAADRVAALPGAARLVATQGGTIPDRGYFALTLPDGARLGELEEEFVFERDEGQVISFAGQSWRILDIGRERVTVAPVPGQPGVMPFWKGGLYGRDPELSEALGAFRRELYVRAADPDAARAWLTAEYPLGEWAAENLARYFHDQRTRGLPVGTDRQLVVEASLDDLGDHQLVVHSCFGNRVNAALALALRRRLRERLGVDPQTMSDDNAVLVRLPAGEEPPPLDLLSLVVPEEAEAAVLDELVGSPMYGTLFRQNAARFLVLGGGRGPRKRHPLWLQRLRSKDLLEATAGLPDFPVRLETVREATQDVLDVERLVRLLERVRTGEVTVTARRLEAPSPVAAGILQRFIGRYMYEYDEPRAERVLRELRVDRRLLDEVLGRGGFDGMLGAEAAAELSAAWQGAADGARARTAEELLALLIRVGPLAEAELSARCTTAAGPLLDRLAADGRVVRFVLTDDERTERRVCAAEDLGLVQAALGPRVTTDGTGGAAEARDPDQARRLLVWRLLEQLGPTPLDELARRSGLTADAARSAAEALVDEGRLVAGAFVEGLAERTWVTRDNLERVRRRTLTHLRRQVEPVEAAAAQRLVLERQGLGPARAAGPGALATALERLALRPLPAELLERELLPARVEGYRSAWLDDAVATGSLTWTGWGERRIVLVPRDRLDLLPAAPPLADEADARLAAALERRGACFLGEAAEAAELSPAEAQRRLWTLVWAGHATNDRLESLRRGLAAGFDAAVPEPAANVFTGRTSSWPRRGPRPRAHAWGGAGAGRWSLVPRRTGDGSPEDWSARLEGWVELLLARWGFLARELAADEPLAPPWTALAPVLEALELRGDLRRGMFVAGLRAAQFAPAAIVDRLRALRAPAGDVTLVSAADPAFVGTALGGGRPGGEPTRRPGNHAVLEDGRVVLAAEGGGRRLRFADGAEAARRRWIATLAELLDRERLAVRVETIDDVPAARSPWRALFEAAGYRPDGEALERRRFDPAPP